jgi:hypothetical protein
LPATHHTPARGKRRRTAVERAPVAADAGRPARQDEYDRPVVRFLLLAVPALLLWFAGAGYVTDAMTPNAAQVGGEHGQLLVAIWLLEALALAVLYLLVQSRNRASWWLDGLAAGGVAWLFRGPLLVVSAMTIGRLPREPWWTLAQHQLVLYLGGGLLLAAVARHTGLVRGDEAPDAGGAQASREPG